MESIVYIGLDVHKERPKENVELFDTHSCRYSDVKGAAVYQSVNGFGTHKIGIIATM